VDYSGTEDDGDDDEDEVILLTKSGLTKEHVRSDYNSNTSTSVDVLLNQEEDTSKGAEEAEKL